MSKKPQLWSRPFILLVLAGLFTFLSFQMLLPVMPPYIQSIGASKLEIGLVTTLFTVAAVISRPYIGFMLRTKARKPLIVIGAVSLLLVTVLYPLTQIVWLFLLLRFSHGLAWGWSSTVNGTAAFDLVPRTRVGEGMGYYMLSITVAMIIAPSMGIYIYQSAGFDPLISISAGLGIVALILFLTIRFPLPASVQTQRAQPPQRFSFRDTLIDRNSLFPAFVTLCVSFGNGSIVTYIVIFGEERGLEQIFLFYLCNALMATIVRPITGKWFDRRGPWSLVLLCCLLSFVALWVLAYTHGNLMLIVTGALFGAGYGSVIPALQAWVLSVTTEEKSGTANGMFYSAIDLGIGISALILGVLSVFMDTANLFIATSFCFLIAAVLVLMDWKRQKRKPLRFERGQ